MPWEVEENRLEQEEESGAWIIDRVEHIYMLPLRYGLEIGPQAILAALVRYATEFSPHEKAILKVLEPGSRLRVLSPVSDDQYPNAPTHTLWWKEPRVIDAAVLELRASGEMPSSGDARALDEEQLDELHQAWQDAYGTVTSSLGRRRPNAKRDGRPLLPEIGAKQVTWAQEEFDRTLSQLLRAWRSKHGEPSGSGLRGLDRRKPFHPSTQLCAAPKGTPTELNVSVLSEYFGPRTRIPNQLEATAVPHLRRCMKAGYVVPDPKTKELVLTPAGEKALAEHRRVNLRWMEQYETNKARLQKAGGLGAAPGDVDGFVQEISEGAVARIERLFTQAGIHIDEKPMTARRAWAFRATPADNWRDVMIEPADHPRPPGQLGLPGAKRISRISPDLQRPILFYLWMMSHLDRGVRKLEALTDHGQQLETPKQLETQSAVTLLAAKIWEIGRDIGDEVERHWNEEYPARAPIAKWWRSPQGNSEPGVRDPRETLAAIVEAIRSTLKWPILTRGYQFPCPVDWPIDSSETVQWTTGGYYAGAYDRYGRMTYQAMLGPVRMLVVHSQTLIVNPSPRQWVPILEVPNGRRPIVGHRYDSLEEAQQAAEREARNYL